MLPPNTKDKSLLTGNLLIIGTVNNVNYEQERQSQGEDPVVSTSDILTLPIMIASLLLYARSSDCRGVHQLMMATSLSDKA